MSGYDREGQRLKYGKDTETYWVSDYPPYEHVQKKPSWLMRIRNHLDVLTANVRQKIETFK